MSIGVNYSTSSNIWEKSATLTRTTDDKSKNAAPVSGKVIDLSAVNTSDTSKIDAFLSSKDKSQWTVKVGNEYINLADNKTCIAFMSNLKASIGGGLVNKAEISDKGLNIFFNNNGKTYVGVHDNDGYNVKGNVNDFLDWSTLGLTDAVGLTDQTAHSATAMSISKLETFKTPEDAETYSKGRSGAEIIVRNKEGTFDVYSLKNQDNAKINSRDFKLNYSTLVDDLAGKLGGTHAFVSTDDKHIMAISGNTAVDVGKIDYNVADVNLKVEIKDIDGVETNSKGDVSGTIKGTVTIDFAKKVEEFANKFSTEYGVKVNVRQGDKGEFILSANYDGIQRTNIDLMTIKPNANGSLSIDVAGLVQARLDLNKGGTSSVGALGISGDATWNGGTKINTGISVAGSTVVGDNLFISESKASETGFVIGTTLTGSPVIGALGAMATEMGAEEVNSLIASTAIGLAKSMKESGFIVPEEILKIDPNKLTTENKVLLSNFLNGKLDIGFDVGHFAKIPGYEKLSIDDLQPADQSKPMIGFANKGGKLEISINAEIKGSSDRTLPSAIADKEGPDKLTGSITADYNNLSLEAEAKVTAEAHITKDETGALDKKFKTGDVSGDFNISGGVKVKSETVDLSKSSAEVDIDISAKNATFKIPGSNMKAYFNIDAKASAGASFELLQDDNKAGFNVSASTVLNGSLYDGNTKIASLDYFALKGQVSYKKDGGNSISADGAFALTGSYQDVKIQNLNGQGHLDITQGKGLSLGGAGSIKIGGYGNKPAVFTYKESEIKINEISGKGSLSIDGSGNIRNANISGKIDISGKVEGLQEDFAIKANGKVGFDMSGDLITIDAKAGIDYLKLGNVELTDLTNFEGKIVYNKKTGELSVTAGNKPLDIDCKVNGKDLSIKGAELGLTIKGNIDPKNPANASLDIIPSGKLEYFKYDEYEAKDVALENGKISLSNKVEGTSTKQVVSFGSVDGNDFTLKGNLVMPDGKGGKEESRIALVSAGTVSMSAENTNGNRRFALSSDITVKQLSYESVTNPDNSVAFKDLNITGNIILENNKVAFKGKNDGENFKISGELYTVTDGKVDPKIDISFETKGEISLTRDKNKETGERSTVLTCDQSFKGNYGDYKLNNLSVEGKVVFNEKKNGTTELSFKGLNASAKPEDDKFKISGSVTVPGDITLKLNELSIGGSMSVNSEGKLKFENLKGDMTGEVNGIPLNFVTHVNGDETKGYEFGLSAGLENTLSLESGFKISRTEDNKFVIKGNAKIATEGENAVGKMIEDVSKIPLGKAMAETLSNLQTNVQHLTGANASISLENMELILDPATMTTELSADVKGQIGGIGVIQTDDYVMNESKLSQIKGDLSRDASKILQKETKNGNVLVFNFKEEELKGKTKETLMRDKLSEMGITNTKDQDVILKSMDKKEYNTSVSSSSHVNINGATGKISLTDASLSGSVTQINTILQNAAPELQGFRDNNYIGTIDRSVSKGGDKQKIVIKDNPYGFKKIPITFSETGINEDKKIEAHFKLAGIIGAGAECNLSGENGMLKVDYDNSKILGIFKADKFLGNLSGKQMEEIIESPSYIVYMDKQSQVKEGFDKKWIESGKTTDTEEYKTSLAQEFKTQGTDSYMTFREGYESELKKDFAGTKLYSDFSKTGGKDFISFLETDHIIDFEKHIFDKEKTEATNEFNSTWKGETKGSTYEKALDVHLEKLNLKSFDSFKDNTGIIRMDKDKNMFIDLAGIMKMNAEASGYTNANFKITTEGSLLGKEEVQTANGTEKRDTFHLGFEAEMTDESMISTLNPNVDIDKRLGEIDTRLKAIDEELKTAGTDKQKPLGEEKAKLTEEKEKLQSKKVVMGFSSNPLNTLSSAIDKGEKLVQDGVAAYDAAVGQGNATLSGIPGEIKDTKGEIKEGLKKGKVPDDPTIGDFRYDVGEMRGDNKF